MIKSSKCDKKTVTCKVDVYFFNKLSYNKRTIITKQK